MRREEVEGREETSRTLGKDGTEQDVHLPVLVLDRILWGDGGEADKGALRGRGRESRATTEDREIYLVRSEPFEDLVNIGDQLGHELLLEGIEE